MGRSPNPLFLVLAIIVPLIYILIRDSVRYRQERVQTRRFSVADHFSRFPGWGDNSPESFRALLVDQLNDPGKLVIDLDNTMGFSSAFLRKAFLGLKQQFPDVCDRLRFESQDGSLSTEIWGYIHGED